MNVFVYGTLKKMCHNHYILRDSEFMFNATTLSSEYEMYDLVGFPAMTKGGEFRIDGEVYKVEDEVLKSLDYLESNGVLYNREEIKIRPVGANVKIVTAWAYMYLGSISSYRGRSTSVNTIKSWREWGQ